MYRAYYDDDALIGGWFPRIRKCVVEFHAANQLVYRRRYFTTWFPRLKKAKAARAVGRLLQISGAKK